MAHVAAAAVVAGAGVTTAAAAGAGAGGAGGVGLRVMQEKEPISTRQNEHAVGGYCSHFTSSSFFLLPVAK